jgi:hypothetical protein
MRGGNSERQFRVTEFDEDQQNAVRKAAEMARRAEGRHTLEIGSGEAYAFRQRSDEIAWGSKSGDAGFAGDVVAL